MRELEIETQVAQMMGRAHTKAPDPSLLEPCQPGEGEDKTYLLFTTGSLTYSPHQIGEPAPPSGVVGDTNNLPIRLNSIQIQKLKCQLIMLLW